MFKVQQSFSDLGKRSRVDTSHTNPARWNSCEQTGGSAPSSSDCLKIGTWNVQGLVMATGKLPNILKEMDRMKIDILGITETHWKGEGDYLTDIPTVEGSFRILYSGGKKTRNGVAVIMNNKARNTVMEWDNITDRIMCVKIKSTPVNMNMFITYAPTADKESAVKEAFYEQLKEVIKSKKIFGENVIVMGDFNAKVGEQKEEKIVGPFGLDDRNESGEMLISFCKEQKLIITNTWFEQKQNARHTWRAPNGRANNQIDFVLVSERYRNSVRNAKARPGADCGADHNPVVVTLKCKLKKVQKGKKSKNLELGGNKTGRK